MAPNHRDLTDHPIKNSEDLRMVCDKARRACLELADALFYVAKHIQARLKAYEKANRNGGLNGLAVSMWRPRAVAVVMLRAAFWAQSAAKVCDKVWRTYMKHYADDMHASSYGRNAGRFRP
jgi:hypothetical protein